MAVAIDWEQLQIDRKASAEQRRGIYRWGNAVIAKALPHVLTAEQGRDTFAAELRKKADPKLVHVAVNLLNKKQADALLKLMTEDKLTNVTK
jgi:hypothetical protein